MYNLDIYIIVYNQCWQAGIDKNTTYILAMKFHMYIESLCMLC